MKMPDRVTILDINIYNVDISISEEKMVKKLLLCLMAVLIIIGSVSCGKKNEVSEAEGTVITESKETEKDAAGTGNSEKGDEQSTSLKTADSYSKLYRWYEVIAVCRVTDASCVDEDDFCTCSFSVTGVLKGDLAPGSVIETDVFSDADKGIPVPAVGEDYILCLDRVKKDGDTVTARLTAGSYQILESGKVSVFSGGIMTGPYTDGMDMEQVADKLEIGRYIAELPEYDENLYDDDQDWLIKIADDHGLSAFDGRRPLWGDDEWIEYLEVLREGV